MKTSTLKMNAVLTAVVLATGSLFAQAPAAPAAAPAAAAPKAKTLEEVFAFLPETAAEVGDKKITKKELLAQIAAMGAQAADLAAFDAAMLQEITKNLIDDMVNRSILLDLAAAKGLVPSEAALKKELDDNFNALPKDKKEMQEQQFKMMGKSFAQYRDEVAKDPNYQQGFVISKYMNNELMDAEKKVSAEDVDKFYREHQKDYFAMPETVTVSHILIPVEEGKDADAKKKADDLHGQLKQGAKFEDLAKANSSCPSGAASGGKLLPFDRNGMLLDGSGSMIKEFADASFSVEKPGAVTEPVKTKFGYHIIRLEEKKAAATMPKAQVEDQIKKFLSQKAVSDMIDAEKAKKNIKITPFIGVAPATAPAAPAAK